MTVGREQLSVVICTKDRPTELATCLDSLQRQTRLPSEVVVVDASRVPPDDVIARARQQLGDACPLHIIHAEPGLPRQRNIGASASTGSVVVFLDDDVVLESGYLAEIAAVYARDEHGEKNGVGGRLTPDPTPYEGVARRTVRRLFLLPGYGRGCVKRSGQPEFVVPRSEEQDVEFLSGCNMSFRREVLDTFRFDERLRGYALGEDLEFSYRVSRRWRLRISPRAVLDHRETGGGRPLPGAKVEMLVFNQYVFFREHVARTALDWLTFLWAAFGGLLWTLRHPGQERLRGYLRGHVRVLAHLLQGGAPFPESCVPITLPSRSELATVAPSDPVVSVVVPVRNEEPFLGRCLDSLLAQDYPPGQLEIIVVENHSTDGTPQVAGAYAARWPHVRVVVSQAVNQAAAMNDGLAAARGGVIARVDGHSYVAADYIQRVVHALARHHDAVGVGGPFLPAGESLLERVAGLARSSRAGVGGGYGADRRSDEHPVRSVQCGAYRRAALLASGGFDVAMAYGEDEELNWRLGQGGAHIILCPQLRQYYRPRATLRALARQYWNYGQGRLRVVLKHPEFLQPKHLAPSALVLGLLALAPLAAFSVVGQVAFLSVLALYGLVLAGAALATLSTGWREAMLVPPAIITLHLSYGLGMLWGAARQLGRRLGWIPPRKGTEQWQCVAD